MYRLNVVRIKFLEITDANTLNTASSQFLLQVAAFGVCVCERERVQYSVRYY